MPDTAAKPHAHALAQLARDFLTPDDELADDDGSTDDTTATSARSRPRSRPHRPDPSPPERRAGLHPWNDQRPRARADCHDRPRPCPWVGCRHHLLLDVTPGGTLTLSRAAAPPDHERFLRPRRRSLAFEAAWHDRALDALDRIPHSCALDLADRGPHELAAIGTNLGVSDERIRHIVATALAALRERVSPDSA